MSKQRFSQHLSTSFPPFIGTPRGATDTPADIIALPSDWVPNQSASHVVEKLTADKKRFHEQCVSNFEEQMARVNYDVEQGIRGASEEVNSIYIKTKQSANALIAEFTFDFNAAAATNRHHKTMYDELRAALEQKCAFAKCAIAQLEDQLKAIEAERIARFAQILKAVREEMEAIGYLLPHDAQAFCEREMMRLNQITMSNHRTYSGLVVRLIKVAASAEVDWQRRVDALAYMYEIKHADFIEKDRLQRDWLMEAGGGGEEWTLATLRDYAERMTGELFQIASVFVGAVHILYQLLDFIYMGSFDEVQHLQLNFVGNPLREYNSIYLEVYHSLFGEFSFEVIDSSTASAVEKWEKVAQCMRFEVDGCRKATETGLHLWDKHFQRRFDAKEVFFMDLSMLIEKSCDAEDGLLIDLHVAIDNLRMRPDEHSLKVKMGECQKIIDNIVKSINKNYDKVVKYFDKFREIMREEAAILFMEMLHYLVCQPSDDDVNPTMFRGRQSRVGLPVPENKPILMKEFDADIKCLHNILYGVNNYLTTAADKSRDDIMAESEVWIKEIMVTIDKQMRMKRRLAENTFQRIFHHVYRIRLAELQHHERRLKEHILAVSSEMQSLYPASSTYARQMDAFQQNIMKLGKSLASAKNTRDTIVVEKQLNGLRKSALNEISAMKLKYHEHIVATVDRLLRLNIAYLQHVRFFGEDGDYHPDEVVELRREITQLNADVRKEKEVVARAVDLDAAAGSDQLQAMALVLEEEMAEMNKHFAFHEFLIAQQKEVRAALKTETHALLEANSVLSGFVTHLKELADANVGAIDYLDEFVDNCEHMEVVFKGVFERILQQEVFCLRESLFDVAPNEEQTSTTLTRISMDTTIVENLEGKIIASMVANKESEKITLSSKSSKSKSKSNQVSTVQPEPNFQILLTGIPPGDNYMARVVKLLFKSLELLQQHAQKYYRDVKLNSEEEEDEVYVERMKAFMVSNMAKYLYYQLQCDEILVEVIINYILELDQLLTYMLDYYKQSLYNFIRIKLDDLSLKCAAYKKDMRMRKHAIENQYKAIHSKLKPLHGHPNNKNLLDELSNQLVELEDKAIEQQLAMDELFSHYEAMMEANIATFEEQMERMETRLKDCVRRFLMLYIDDERIFEQLKGKIGYFERILHDEKMPMIATDIETGSMSTINIEILNTLNSKLDSLKCGLKIHSIPYATALKSKWIQVSSIKEKYSSADHTQMSSLETLDLYNAVENFRADQQTCLDEIANWRDILEMSKLRMEIWRNDVASINTLYAVKYLPPPPKLDDENKGAKKKQR